MQPPALTSEFLLARVCVRTLSRMTRVTLKRRPSSISCKRYVLRCRWQLVSMPMDLLTFASALACWCCFQEYDKVNEFYLKQEKTLLDHANSLVRQLNQFTRKTHVRPSNSSFGFPELRVSLTPHTGGRHVTPHALGSPLAQSRAAKRCRCSLVPALRSLTNALSL